MEFIVELIFEIFAEAYLAIMTAFLPKTKLKKHQMKMIVAAEAIILIFMVISGAVMVAEPEFNTLAGKILVSVSASIIVLQSAFGIIVKIKKMQEK